jgi:hypothetical protein
MYMHIYIYTYMRVYASLPKKFLYEKSIKAFLLRYEGSIKAFLLLY